ncbi:hypothetical protein [Allosphingosinicella indica]|uniref:Uncharacterized protein n=1 Tax=Allosphingosinicella indica TaxID=941907 RepID=A0A1X7GDA9_9SPHN|nr:hypothetical protein [Allosphingosinicella indica]SMF68091.1 hypothetical protein SAMN06295910_1585 [Allosphingosinicella indica]
MALVADTQRLLRRADEALGQAPLMGPKLLGELVGSTAHLNDALRENIEAMEKAVEKLGR